MHKNGFLRLFLLLMMLVPIGLGATWGVYHSRPNFSWLKAITKDGNRFVLGKHYLNHVSVLTCLDVGTGEFKSVHFPRPSEIYRHEIGFDGRELWHIESDSEQEQQLYLVSVPDLSVVSKSTIADASNPLEVCAIGSYIVRIQSDSITVESTENRIRTDSMPLGFSVDRLLYPIVGTQNVLVYERPKTTGTIFNLVLLKIDSGKISQIASWKALDHRVMDKNSPQYIAILLPDGTTIETIDVIDGKVYCSKSLPDEFGLRLPLTSLAGDFALNWNHFHQRDSGGMNLLSGVAIKVPEGFQGIWHDVQRQRLFCRGPFNDQETEISVLDLRTGSLLFQFHLPFRYYHAAELQIVGDQLFIASVDGRVFFYDLNTGTLVRTLDPFRWVHWINCFCALAFLAWCILWSKFSIGTHLHGLIDLIVYALPILAYVIMVYLHVGVQGRSEPTIVSFGITIGLSILASVWCAIGRARWSLGVLPTLLCVLFGLAFHSFTIGKAGIYAPFIVWSILCTSIAASGFIMLLRSSSARFFRTCRSSPELSPETMEQKRKVYSLRDLFLWTTCSGIFFAMLKNDLCIVWMDWSIPVIAIPLGLFLAFLSSVAAYLAMCCNDLIARRGAQFSCVLVMLCVFFADPAGIMLFPRIAITIFGTLSFVQYLIPVWLTVYLGLYTFRLRGWRIRSMIPSSVTIEAPT